MLIQGQVEQAVTAVRSSGPSNVQQLQLGELAVSEVLPRYGAIAWSGLLYTISHSAAQALSVNSTTFTGLAVANPANSGKNLMIADVTLAVAAATSAISTPRLGYAAIVALTQGNATSNKGLPVLVGTGGGSVALCGASATLAAAPTTLRPLTGSPWVTAGAGWTPIYTKDDVAGAIIIPPGQMLTIDALVGAMSVIAGVTWAELPI